MRRVLVLDAQGRPGLVAIRRLGRCGYTVTAGSNLRLNAGWFSKHTGRRLLYSSPATDEDAFLRAIEVELSAREYDLLLPVDQQTVELVVGNRARFEPYTTIPFPPTDIVEVGLDKAKTIRAARDAGVTVPESVLAVPDDVASVADHLGYPVVVKPCRGTGRSGVTVCESPDELRETYHATVERHGRTILQEFIPAGEERGVYTLYDGDGRLVRVTVQRRLRSHPPEGGASTYRETVSDPDLVEVADRLLGSIGWHSGVAMVEFRTDPRTGDPVLMEINPRLWGSLTLSVFAGVDFPNHLSRVALGEPVEPDLRYAVGVRSRDLFRDLQQLRQREDTATAVGEFFEPSPRPCSYDGLSWDDPLPTLGHCLYYSKHLHRLLRSRLPRSRPAQAREESSVEVG